MKRRDFITLLGGAAVAWPLAARAQQPAMPVIGFLRSTSPEGAEHLVAAFRDGLKGTGYVDGQTVGIEWRWARGDVDRLPELAADLVRRQVNVIVANGVRRDFITLLGGTAAAWPVTAHAQQGEQMRRIGVLLATGQKDPDTPNRIAAMRQALQSFGWNEGRNLWIDIRFGEGDTKLIQKHAVELVGSNPDAILVLGTVVVMALRQVTRSIPVVFVQVSDPVQAGFVSSLSHPGGNITGFTTYEYTMGAKWLEVLKDVSPSVTRVLFLLNPENTAQWAGFAPVFETFGPTTGVRIVPGAVRDRDEVESVIDSFAREPDGGLLVPPDAITLVHQQLILRLAARHRLPAIYPYRAWAVNGGLLSYGIDVVDQFRRATSYINRILKGENPGDLPVQAPTEFKMVINLKAAKALGLDVPAALVARADEVIE